MIVTLRQEAATAEKSKQTNERDNNDQNMANRTEILARIQVARGKREEVGVTGLNRSRGIQTIAAFPH